MAALNRSGDAARVCSKEKRQLWSRVETGKGKLGTSWNILAHVARLCTELLPSLVWCGVLAVP